MTKTQKLKTAMAMAMKETDHDVVKKVSVPGEQADNEIKA